MADLTTKQTLFVDAYLDCLNATEAARRAGYAHPNKQGPRLLVNVGIAEAVQAGLAERTMPASEVLVRLTNHARGSMADFLRTDASGAPTGFTLGPDTPQHLIKKVSITEKGVSFELYDAQAALVQIGRHYGLFTDKVEHSGTIDVTSLSDDELHALLAS